MAKLFFIANGQQDNQKQFPPPGIPSGGKRLLLWLVPIESVHFKPGQVPMIVLH